MMSLQRYALTALILACGFLGPSFSLPPHMREAPRQGVSDIVA